MLNSNTRQAEDLRIYQIIDANLDRAREGLRVLEDWARFGLGKEKYVEKIKNFQSIISIFFNLIRKLIYIFELDLRSKFFNWFHR